jgi:hypothetical protein
MELGMDKKEDSIFDLIEDLEPVDPKTIAEFERAMDEVIPKIVEVVEERRMLAAESRRRQLKC